MANLSISDSLYIGKGQDRECYQHPICRNKCIKVTVSKNYRQHFHDIKNYRLLERRGIDWTYLSRFYNLCETNLGIGLVFELIKDYNGTVSKTLDHRLRFKHLKINSPSLNKALSILKEFLLEEGITTRDLKGSNILVQYSSKTEYRLVIVDGLGHNELIPVFKLSKALTKMKIERGWKRFLHNLQKKFSS